jgi:hypothetical protein
MLIQQGQQGFCRTLSVQEPLYPSSVTSEKENCNKTWKRSLAMAFSSYFLTAYLIRRASAQTLAG